MDLPRRFHIPQIYRARKEFEAFIVNHPRCFSSPAFLGQRSLSITWQTSAALKTALAFRSTARTGSYLADIESPPCIREKELFAASPRDIRTLRPLTPSCYNPAMLTLENYTAGSRSPVRAADRRDRCHRR